MALEEVKNDPHVEPKPVSPARIPMGTILGELADVMDSTKKGVERYKQVTVIQPLKDLKEDMSQLTQDQIEALRKLAESKENQNLWSYGSLFSSAGYASLSILVGAYIFATGTPEDKKKSLGFIYGGIALLSNTLLDKLGVWNALSKLASFGNESVEGALKIALPIASTLMTMTYGFYQLAGPSNELQTLFKNIDKLMSGINMFVQIGTCHASWVRGQAERRLMILQGKITINSMKVTQINLRNESLTEASKQNHERNICYLHGSSLGGNYGNHSSTISTRTTNKQTLANIKQAGV
jgi:hypothetical protein